MTTISEALTIAVVLPAVYRSLDEMQYRRNRLVGELDALVYADIGMDPLTSALARTRFAPVQRVTWGHPFTTGIATSDYLISSELLEPDNATEGHGCTKTTANRSG